MDSKTLGQNIMFFLDQVKVSGRTAEQRQIMLAYAEICEHVEKIITGELVLTRTEEETDEGDIDPPEHQD